MGGCAGFFSKKGFSFDVGATTLVDFVENGIGGNFFKEIKLDLPKGEYLNYVVWLPDRQITLYRNSEKWNQERLKKIGSTKNHIEFWELMDTVTAIFWKASRQNIKLPIRNLKDLFVAVRAIGIHNLYLVKYVNSTMLDVLKKFKLENDRPLIGFLSMLIEDTVHSSIDKAPFINAALGTTIRGSLHVGVPHSYQTTTQLAVVPFPANSPVLCDVKSFIQIVISFCCLNKLK